MSSNRIFQIILIVSFLGFSWLAMQAVHELGHVLGAIAGGGTLCKVGLYPTVISRTDVFPNPHPLLEVWAGPLVGSILPLLVFLLAAALKAPALYLYRFGAGFCLVANGSYIGGGSFRELGDARDLLLFGAAQWQLILFGLLTAPLGLYLWNGLGSTFGLGAAKGRVNRTATLTSLGLLVATVAIELAAGLTP